jgi:hypothetical protein
MPRPQPPAGKMKMANPPHCRQAVLHRIENRCW